MLCQPTCGAGSVSPGEEERTLTLQLLHSQCRFQIKVFPDVFLSSMRVCKHRGQRWNGMHVSPCQRPSRWKWMVCGKQGGDTILVTSSASSAVLPSAKTITASGLVATLREQESTPRVCPAKKNTGALPSSCDPERPGCQAGGQRRIQV